MNWQVSEPLPALTVPPPDAANLDEAHAAIEQWEHYSKKKLDSAQRLAVELMMAETSDGRWAARTTGRVEPRQNGKGDEIEVVEAWGLTQRGEWIVHTAHEIPTAYSAHRRLVGHLEGHQDLRRMIRQVRYANGNQAIEMKTGAIIVYRTRTAGGGRGLDDISRVVVDEAQHAQPEQLASSLPILAANPNPQTNFIGSAGIADRSDWWWELRVRALRDSGGSFSWLEHSAEKMTINRDGRVLSEAPDPEDRTVWAEANPAYGSRIEEGFLEEQLKTLGPLLFAREHLGVWDPYPGGGEGFLPYDMWETLIVTVEEAKAARSLCVGLAVSSDGLSGSFGTAGRLPGGDLYIDLIKSGTGSEWILPTLTDHWQRHRRPIRVNPAAPEGAYVRPLREAGVEVIEVSSRDFQQACGEVLDTVKNGTIRHLGQSELNRAVKATERRDVGKDGGWVWADPPSGIDLSPLRAATLALTGVTDKQAPRIHVYDPDWVRPSKES